MHGVSANASRPILARQQSTDLSSLYSVRQGWCSTVYAASGQSASAGPLRAAVTTVPYAKLLAQRLLGWCTHEKSTGTSATSTPRPTAARACLRYRRTFTAPDRSTGCPVAVGSTWQTRASRQFEVKHHDVRF
ncbi:hypothetical protein SPHINGOAX6_50399 [Sphingomonas sp. AX6]|nr:hypothetical protein SPHINGOAX6_50399 [Sphingomonas sp. AX6]